MNKPTQQEFDEAIALDITQVHHDYIMSHELCNIEKLLEFKELLKECIKDIPKYVFNSKFGICFNLDNVNSNTYLYISFLGAALYNKDIYDECLYPIPDEKDSPKWEGIGLENRIKFMEWMIRQIDIMCN